MIKQIVLFFWTNNQEYSIVLLDFSLTVKAATLIFISWCGSAISSAKEGKSGVFRNTLFEPRKRAFHENSNRIHTELTFINP